MTQQLNYHNIINIGAKQKDLDKNIQLRIKIVIFKFKQEIYFFLSDKANDKWV